MHFAPHLAAHLAALMAHAIGFGPGTALGSALAALSGMGVGYLLFAWWAIRRFFAAPPLLCHDPIPVSLLKPLHGAEPRLGENLASFLATRHTGPLQMVCGVNTPEDGALGAVEALIAAQPQADIALSRMAPRLGANGKIANLVAMMPLARHDSLILSASDMVAGPDYLPAVLGALMGPGVGAVSCLYVGRSDSGAWSRIGAAMISCQSTPNIIVSLVGGMARPCMGSTIALSRQTLDAIGGFAPLADVLADDYAIGEAVAALGLRVVVPPILLEHAGAEASFGELWRHFLRWAVTIRDLRPAGHAGSVVTHPLPLALLAMPFLAGTGAVPALAALAFAAPGARIAVARAMARASRKSVAPLWCIAAGDILGFMVYGASLFARKIEWRGTRLTLPTPGRIAAQS